MRSRASQGGRANEAGSLYRSGVAAYLAAHGLAGRGVEAAGYPAGGAAPVTLEFETGQAVDDIRCGLADGTVLDLQAKRACGADERLAATVAQWSAQAVQLGRGTGSVWPRRSLKALSGISTLPSGVGGVRFLAESPVARQRLSMRSGRGARPVLRGTRPSGCWTQRS